jgi:predicted RNA-binding protein with TRAM domain
MEIPHHLRCLFSGTVEENADSYTIEVPTQEVQLDNIQPNGTYRVAMLAASTQSDPNEKESNPSQEQQQVSPRPPVEEGETRTVEIEDIGDQGDGVTRVERGFVVIVPDTDQGERVTVEITDVQENVAFATVVERVSYYE